MQPKPAKKAKAGKPWQQLRVRHSGEDLGTLQEVRQKYHRFDIEMRAWDAYLNPPKEG